MTARSRLLNHVVALAAIAVAAIAFSLLWSLALPKS